jgi:putative endonuclease
MDISSRREWSKKSVQQGRSTFGARSVLPVREHGKWARTPLAAFFNIPTLYIGVTSDLIKRCWEHRTSSTVGFTKKHGVHQLVYYELHQDMYSAITREKQLKKWNRKWKLRLIEEHNPQWHDLWNEIV